MCVENLRLKIQLIKQDVQTFKPPEGEKPSKDTQSTKVYQGEKLTLAYSDLFLQAHYQSNDTSRILLLNNNNDKTCYDVFSIKTLGRREFVQIKW